MDEKDEKMGQMEGILLLQTLHPTKCKNFQKQNLIKSMNEHSSTMPDFPKKNSKK